MGKIFVGARACGKTYKLLRTADVLIDEGYTPVFICTNYNSIEYVKNTARIMGIDVSKIEFVSPETFIRKRNEYITPHHRVLIDELRFFLDALTGDKSFYATLDESDTKTINGVKN